MRLQKIEYDPELSAFKLEKNTNVPDRIETKLVLNDYDWMSYSFYTFFPTKEQGALKIKIEYFGTGSCMMTVTQDFQSKSRCHVFEFDANVFKDFLIKFMTKHIDSWNSSFAFCGEELAVEIFNAVLDNHISVKTDVGL